MVGGGQVTPLLQLRVVLSVVQVMPGIPLRSTQLGSVHVVLKRENLARSAGCNCALGGGHLHSQIFAMSILRFFNGLTREQKENY